MKRPKQPAIMWYIGDWLKDPAVRLLTHSARAIWFDLLCAMYESGRTGQLTGTLDQLARLGFCSPAELTLAIAEFQPHRTRDVMERNGVFSIVNRRMKREHKERLQNRLRVQKHRNKDPASVETPMKQECNAPSSSSVSVSLPERQPTTHPALADVMAWGEMLGCPKEEAERFWNHFEASGWIDKNGHAIVNARAKLATWASDARARPLERAHQSSPLTAHRSPVSASADLIHKQETLKRVEAALARLRNNKPENGGAEFQAWVAKLRPLKQQAADLRRQLGFPDV